MTNMINRSLQVPTVFVSLLLLLCTGQMHWAVASDCAPQPNCTSCLAVGGCSWCHSYVYFANGTAGPRCNEDSFSCPGVFDHQYCSTGYLCNYNKGVCEITNIPGEGEPSDACSQHCPQTKFTYRCNQTLDQCVACDDVDPSCTDIGTCQIVCNPPPGAYRCASGQQCVTCEAGDPDCKGFVAACMYCKPFQQYACDLASLTCLPVSSGGAQQDQCNAQCSQLAPPDLNGIWRGIMVQQGFVNGVFQFFFDESGLPNTFTMVVPPIGSDPSYTVHGIAFENYGLWIKFTDGPQMGHTVAGLFPTLAQGPAATVNSTVLAFGPLDELPPDNVEKALGGGGSQVFIIVRGPNFPLPRLSGKAKGEVKETDDPCTKFSDCDNCTNFSEGQVKCGWCLGGNITYNSTGVIGSQCGGYYANQSLPFSCPFGFRTSDAGCESYSCNTQNGTCSVCDAGDKSCIADIGECKNNCPYQSFGQCDPVAGMCYSCSDTTIPGCVPNCAASCPAYHDYVCDGKYCRRQPGTGNMTAEQCAVQCGVRGVRCTNTSQCINTGILEQSACNTGCFAEFSVCNMTTGKCEVCNWESDSKCKTTTDQCHAACQKTDLPGHWRGLQLNVNPALVDIDFYFFENQTFSFGPHNQPQLWYNGSFQLAETPSTVSPMPMTQFLDIGFETVPMTTGELILFPGVKPGDHVQGFFLIQRGNSYTEFDTATLALGPPSGGFPIDYTDAISNDGFFEAVMYRCFDPTLCSWT